MSLLEELQIAKHVHALKRPATSPTPESKHHIRPQARNRKIPSILVLLSQENGSSIIYHYSTQVLRLETIKKKLEIISESFIHSFSDQASQINCPPKKLYITQDLSKQNKEKAPISKWHDIYKDFLHNQ